MRRFLILALVLAFVAPLAVFAGETPAQEEPEELAVMYWSLGTAGPKTIDPSLCGASDGGDIINNTFEGLYREQSGNVIPGIAESYDVSDDGLVYTFHLRESQWSDGSPLTAQDFVYGWKRSMDPAVASEYAWLWHYTNVVGSEEAAAGEGALEDVGVRAIDDLTLEVTLKVPTDYFVSLTSFYTFMPIKQSAAEHPDGLEGAWATNPEIYVSNGAFTVTDYVIGGGLTLTKNPYYWAADEVGLDVIEVKFIDEASTAYTAYQAGELDFLSDVPPAEIPRLLAEDPNFYAFPLLGTYYYNFNMDLEIWSDPLVRRAMAYSIDRIAICEVFGDGRVPAGGFIPPGMLDNQGRDFFETSGTYGISLDDSSYDLARELLAEAGYPNGEGFPEFVMMYNTSEGHQLIAEMIQEMWRTNLGIECTLENQEWAVFQDTRTAGDYELARGGWLTDFMDPMGMLAIFKVGNTYNDPNYNNPAYNEAMAVASSTAGADHFAALYEAQDILMNDMPIIPVYHYTDTFLSSSHLKGNDRSVLSAMDFTRAYLDR